MTTDTAQQPLWLARVRAWLRSDMRVLRWVFLALYLVLVLALFTMATLQEADVSGAMLVCLGVMFAAQAMFILGAGTIQLCRPIRRRRLVLPVIAASFMMLVLTVGLVMALAELFKFSGNPGPIVGWALIAASWIGWGVLLFIYARNLPRYKVLWRFSQVVFAGSLAELLATVPSHLIVSRRPGCLVGIATMLGITAGVGVMIFSFGPMIVLLFLRPMYRAEKEASGHVCENCGYDLRASKDRCPECGQPFVRAATATQNLDPHQVG